MDTQEEIDAYNRKEALREVESKVFEYGLDYYFNDPLLTQWVEPFLTDGELEVIERFKAVSFELESMYMDMMVEYTRLEDHERKRRINEFF